MELLFFRKQVCDIFTVSPLPVSCPLIVQKLGAFIIKSLQLIWPLLVMWHFCVILFKPPSQLNGIWLYCRWKTTLCWLFVSILVLLWFTQMSCAWFMPHTAIAKFHLACMIRCNREAELVSKKAKTSYLSLERKGSRNWCRLVSFAWNLQYLQDDEVFN